MKINRIKSVLVEKDKSQTWLAEKLGKSFLYRKWLLHEPQSTLT